MQQINLFTEAFRPQKVYLSLLQMVLALAACVLLLIALSIWLNVRLDGALQQVNSASAKTAHMQTKVDELAAQAALLKQDDSLVTANKRLVTQIEARETMLRTLDSLALRDDAGFSPFLIGLARQRMEGLSLSRITLASSGASMVLEGETKRAANVPAYLAKLRDESIFVGRNFTMFDIESDADGGAAIRFSLQSNAAAESPYVVPEKAAGARLSELKEARDVER